MKDLRPCPRVLVTSAVFFDSSGFQAKYPHQHPHKLMKYNKFFIDL
jgi:hypothetical protein